MWIRGVNGWFFDLEWEDMLKKLWHNKFVRVLLILLALFVLLMIYRIPFVLEQRKSDETVAFIESRRLTISDVRGDNMPPRPDKELADATLLGVDANNNYIRDDVEWAIFDKYPNDIEVRAAELQYAMALQIFLTNVFTTDTWVAGAQLTGRGFGCIYDTLPDLPTNVTNEEASRIFAIADDRISEVETLVLNTELRKEQYGTLDEKYITSYGSSDLEDCDVNI